MEEAQANLSYFEFCAWIRYQRQRGSLNTGIRIDRAVGRGVSFYGNSLTRNSRLTPADFSPYDKPPEQAAELEPGKVFAFLSAKAKRQI